jgi:thioredoxin 1
MDDDLEQIREKKRREMEDKMKGKVKAGVIHIDEAHFAEAVGQHQRLVIDFWAEWCGPCRMVSPIIEELAIEMAGEVTFAKCNTDESPRTAARLGIEAIPTILFFSQGKMIERVIGAYGKDALKAKIVRAFRLPQ